MPSMPPERGLGPCGWRPQVGKTTAQVSRPLPPGMFVSLPLHDVEWHDLSRTLALRDLEAGIALDTLGFPPGPGH